MSLIGDALKKARADTGSGSGLPPNVFAAPAPRRSNLPWIVAAASTSLAIGVLMGAAIFYRAMPGANPTLPPSQMDGTPAEPSSLSSPSDLRGIDSATAMEPIGATQSESQPSESVGSTPTGSMPVDSGVSGSSDDPPSSSRSSEVAETRSPPTESVGSVREPTPAKPASAPARALAVRDGESFLREARLSGGTTLRLTGIVWSDASPAALINGEVYSVGEGDGAWSVAEVQRGEVTIESDGLRFSLRLK